MLKLSLILLISFGFSMSSQAEGRFEPLINGGEKVLSDDPIFQSTVMLETDAQYCSASIVAPGLLLTAAHCLSGDSSWILIHFAGLEGKLSRNATRSFRHENYQDLNDTTRNDVALVFFDGALPEGYRPVPILPLEKAVQLGEELQLAGYGGGSPLGSLAKIKLTATGFLNNNNLVTFNQTPQHGICHGDSGGPAFKMIDGQLYLAGVASYAHEIDCSGYSAYTTASPFIEWIQKKLKE